MGGVDEINIRLEIRAPLWDKEEEKGPCLLISPQVKKIEIGIWYDKTRRYPNQSNVLMKREK